MRECSFCQSCFPDAVQFCERDGRPTRTTLPGETVVHGRYHLEKRVGSGSVSVVYVAKDELLGTNPAVKIILPDIIGKDQNVAERFLIEVTAASAIRHANILAVTDSGLINGLMPFLVMDFIHGSSLGHTLSSRGRLTPSEALEYISTIGNGLAAAHEQGIVHGDLKPRNILIERDRPLVEAIRIADFGLSTIKSGKLHGPRVAKSTGILRSPLYLAPEGWSEDESDTRSDIYSLGVILYQMLAGDVPFKGKSIPAIMKGHLMDPPPPIAGLFPDISSELESVVLHALEKDPAKRTSTIERFVEELRYIVTNHSAMSIESADLKSKHVRVAAKPRIAKAADRAPVPYVSEGLTRNNQPLAEELTLVNFRDIDESTESSPIDLNQTIVISKHGVGSEKLRAFTPHDHDATKLAPDEPTVAYLEERDFEMTIIPGKVNCPLVEHRDEPARVEDEQELDVEVDEQESEDLEWVSRAALADSAFANSVNEGEALPRSIPPIFLAAGVVLIIVLIGLGVYYSRMSQ